MRDVHDLVAAPSRINVVFMGLSVGLRSGKMSIVNSMGMRLGRVARVALLVAAVGAALVVACGTTVGECCAVARP